MDNNNDELLNSTADGVSKGIQPIKDIAAKAGDAGKELAGAAIQASTGIPVNKAMPKGSKHTEKSSRSKNDLQNKTKSSTKNQSDDILGTPKKGKMFSIIAVSIFSSLFGLCLMIVIFLQVLTPSSVTGLNISQYDVREDGIYSIAEEYQNTLWGQVTLTVLDSIRELFGQLKVINLFSSNEAEAEDTYEMGEWNPSDEYADSLMENHDMCQVALKKAFKTAKSEAVSILVEEYDYSFIEATTVVYTCLKNHDCDSWDKVYKNINYGDMVSAINIAMSMNGIIDVNDFSSADYEAYLKKEEVLTNLYHLSVSVSVTTDEKGRKIKSADVQIASFDVYDLFKICDASPNDEYDTNITFYDMMQLMTEQQEAIADENQTVLDAYGFEFETPLSLDHSSTSISDVTSNYATLSNFDGTNEQVVWKYLKEAGFSDIGAAAVMGNIASEHAFQTSMSGDQGSVGLCQWAGGRRTGLESYAAGLGKDVTDINVQAAYLVYIDYPSRMGSKISLDGYNGTTGDYVKQATDLISATDVICVYFESPALYSSKEEWAKGKYNYISWDRFVYTDIDNKYHLDLGKRRAYAQMYYDMYAGTE